MERYYTNKDSIQHSFKGTTIKYCFDRLLHYNIKHKFRGASSFILILCGYFSNSIALFTNSNQI